MYLLLLITDWGQGSPFPARFAGVPLTVPLDAEVQLGDSLEETVEVEDVGISAEIEDLFGWRATSQNLIYSSPDVAGDGDGEGECEGEDGEGEETGDEHGEGRVLLQEVPQRRHDGDRRRRLKQSLLSTCHFGENAVPLRGK